MSAAPSTQLPLSAGYPDVDSPRNQSPSTPHVADDIPEGRIVERASLLHDEESGQPFRSSSTSTPMDNHTSTYTDGDPYAYSYSEPQTPRSFLLIFIILPAVVGLALFYNYRHPISLFWDKSGGITNTKSIPAYMLNDTVSPTILISIDGLRHDYVDRKDHNGDFLAPNLRALAEHGVRAMPGMHPVMPTKTFPNHWTLVTGLYPEDHGIIGNTMYSTEKKQWFHESTKDPYWWGGEPIWQTLQRTPRLIRDANGTVGKVSSEDGQGVVNYTAATVFWVGSDIESMLPDAYWHYDGKVSYKRRVERAVELLRGRATDLGIGRGAQFVTLYFQRVDSMGHSHGPESDQVNREIMDVDKSVGMLLQKLNETVPVPVNIIIVSDHGMTETSSERVVDLEEDLPAGSVQDVEQTPIGLWLNMTEGADKVLERMQAGFKRQNNKATAYRKENLPERWHLREGKHLTPVVSIADIGWTVTYPSQSIVRAAAGAKEGTAHTAVNGEGLTKRASAPVIRGNHGFDDNEPDMQAIFIASGPAFKKGAQVTGFRSLDLYPLLCELFSATPAPHNGSVEISRTSILADAQSRR